MTIITLNILKYSALFSRRMPLDVNAHMNYGILKADINKLQ